MAALIVFLLIAQQLLGAPGHLTELVPGDLDTTVLEMDGYGIFQVAFGAGCEAFAPDMDVYVLAGSHNVASLTDADGNGLCNVEIGQSVEAPQP